jgi:hypothetical protein
LAQELGFRPQRPLAGAKKQVVGVTHPAACLLGHG